MSSFSPTQLASLRDMGIYEPFQQLVSWGNVYKSDINDHSPNTASSSVIQVDTRVDDHNNIIKVTLYIHIYFSQKIFTHVCVFC